MEPFEGEFVTKLPCHVDSLENIHGIIVAHGENGRDYVITLEGHVRDITGSVYKFRSMAL